MAGSTIKIDVQNLEPMKEMMSDFQALIDIALGCNNREAVRDCAAHLYSKYETKPEKA